MIKRVVSLSIVATIAVVIMLLMNSNVKEKVETPRLFKPCRIIAQNDRDDTLSIEITPDSTISLTFGDANWSFYGLGKMRDSTNGQFECVEFVISKSRYAYQSDKMDLGLIGYDSLPSTWTLKSLYLLNDQDTTRLAKSPFVSQTTEIDLSKAESYIIKGQLATKAFKGDIFPFESVVSQNTSSIARTIKREIKILDSSIVIRDAFETRTYTIVNRSDL